MTNHTPGPWHQSGNHIYSHNGNICQLSEPRATRYIEHRPLDRGSDDWDEGMSNAQLIAAAPELLAACTETIKAIEDWMSYGNECPLCGHHYNHPGHCPTHKINQAIAKAKGENNARQS